MDQSTERRILQELLHRIETHTNADAGCVARNPTSSYVSAELAAREWQAFFVDHPQLIGLSGDLPAPGCYRTLDDFGVPVLATRDSGGRFRAFVNLCRHRGTRLVAEERGSARRFVCPFHGWTYSGEGELHAIPEAAQFGNVDRRCLGLLELPAEERHGLLWVHPRRDGALDLDRQLGALNEDFAYFDVSHHVWRAGRPMATRMNWKLANDTFGESYHFARLHRNTFNQLFHGDVITYEVFGRNHRLVFPSRGIHALKRKPESEWHLENATTLLYFLFPNVQLSVSRRQVSLFRIYPDRTNPSRSVTQVSHYFSAETLRQIDAGTKTVIDAANVYDPAARDGNAVISPEAAMEMLDSTLEQEDFKVAELTQQAADSGALDYLVFGRNEPALHHFHHVYREALGMPPLERYEEMVA